MPASRSLLKAEEVATLIDSLAGKMAREVSAHPGEWALVGIRTGGEVLARRLADAMARQGGSRLPVGALDITLYRDDLGAGAGGSPVVRETEIGFPLDGRSLFLVDDVLYTGRTVRAALDELMDFGRPARIRLAVLVDRGGRELPVQADLVGKAVEAPAKSRVVAKLREAEGEDGVYLMEKGA